jgi:hypothetical protein
MAKRVELKTTCKSCGSKMPWTEANFISPNDYSAGLACNNCVDSAKENHLQVKTATMSGICRECSSLRDIDGKCGC